MKTYYATDGFRTPALVWVREEPGNVVRHLEHHVRHSPDGHSWGYGGSGPAELAKDVLWDLLGQEPPTALYQAFKWAFIAPLAQDEGFEIRSDTIEAWLAEQEMLDAGLGATPDG